MNKTKQPYQKKRKIQNKANKLSYTDMIKTLLSFQATFLSVIRTVSIFIGVSILAKSKWLLIFIILIFSLSIYNYYKISRHIYNISKRFRNENIKLHLEVMNMSIYSFSAMIILILFIVIIKKEI